MNYRERIAIDPRVRSGKPCIRGTRITVADVFDYLGGGMTIPEILERFSRSHRRRHSGMLCVRRGP